jgi:transcriptional regulator of acetoin/glycerol metabolism
VQANFAHARKIFVFLKCHNQPTILVFIISVQALNRYLTEPSNAIGGTLLIDENERNLVKIAISKSKYNLSKAADMLGVSRTTLYRKIKKYEINHR